MANILYVTDVETTGIDDRIHEIIELSLFRLSDQVQKTFFLKPMDLSTAEPEALRINGHRLEDLKAGFRPENKETNTSRIVYQDPSKVLVEVESFLMQDGMTSTERVLVGQNITFDKGFLQNLWKRHDQSETFPFGRMYLDTMQIAAFLDYVTGQERQSYHLNGLIKDLGVKRIGKAHNAESDVHATVSVFTKLVELAKRINK